ncbi:MAG: TrbC/VirB2 family protein [Thermales bacterium]|nr:TrbC/VirB2 family protein [Thermales bacterium]
MLPFYIYNHFTVVTLFAQDSGQVFRVDSIDSLLWSIVKTIQYYTLPIMAIVIAAFGIRLLTSGENVSTKESSKSWIIKVLIGSAIIFGATTIATLFKTYLGG